MRWKEVEYNGSDSVERLQRLQALCASASTENDRRPDGLLIVGGVDSFHSQASQAALKYLFLGSSGQELLGEQVISHEHERLEDVVLLISRQRIAVFYSSESEAAVKILPVISKWRHVAEYIIHDGMEPDEQEERKVRAFKSMMTGIQRVGIPFGLNSGGKNLVDVMLPEKWPLIQSYGLEGGDSTAKGFFTMNHQVVNVSAELMRAMAQLDGFSAKRVVLESEPFLAHHFDEFLLKLDHAESPEARNVKSESDLGEDLLSFYEFGTMQFPARGLTTQPTRGSRVLYGARTSSLTVKSSSSALLANSGAVQGIAATHMLVQAEDPFTGVRLARTYFLSSSKVCRKIVDEDALVHPPVEDPAPANNAKDTQRLIELYALLLQGFKASAAKLVQECMTSDEASLEQCIAAARAAGIQLMVEMSRTQSQVLESSAFSANFLSDQLRLTAEMLDSRGQPVQAAAQGMSLSIFSLLLTPVF
ncbi:hypothetical protein BBJ28_00011088 [Nothophytophthora sp. Chile5]|nr:hypothetical protein BBJ28_00011088 [Nothophytophthora sp. Chile5]